MTIVKATCPCCGEVELAPEQVRLVVCNADPSRSRYIFTCPKCSLPIEKPADDRVITLLVSGGVTPEQLQIPAEALEVHTGKPITYDEILDWHKTLDRATYLAAHAQREMKAIQ